MPVRLLFTASFLALMATAAMFGFFYAWVCSTMWGLDTIEPEVAITAMQAMNASVRNVAFGAGFFGTPVILLGVAVIAGMARQKAVSVCYLAAAFTYLAGFVITVTVNVPMNDALTALGDARLLEDSVDIWADYSQRWQFWNVVRTITSGSALLLAGVAMMLIGRQAQAFPRQ